VDLANQTLLQAQDRFSSGVADNLEVVQAQQSVADASETLITSQYQNNLSKVELARALGLAEAGIRSYFAQASEKH
jgi:outer membrane protein TolC